MSTDTKFIGAYRVEEYHPARGKCVGNFNRRMDAEEASERLSAIVTPYLNGLYKSGWVVFAPYSVKPVEVKTEDLPF